MNVFKNFEKKIKKSLESSDIKGKNGEDLDLSKITVDPPRDSSHGHLSTNAAMVLAKSTGLNPRALAEKIIELLKNDPSVESINVAGPGFINIKLTKPFWQDLIKSMLEKGISYGRIPMGQGKRINVEYVSANPTGPMHVGHCRGAVVGDVLSNLLQFVGYNITKEYYINDAGKQIEVLAHSVLLRYREALGQKINEIPEGLYPGEYLIPLGQSLAQEFGDKLLTIDKEEALSIVKERAIHEMMSMIRKDLAALNIYHDIFFSERMLYADNARAIRNTINDLTLKGYIYKGKLPPPKGQNTEDWEPCEQTLFRSTDVGDDQDRVLIKSDGSYTYFAADVAYFRDKFNRHFDEMIYILGADHAGYVKRLEAMAKAISNDKAKLSVFLCQLVKLFRNGHPVRMSKRAGSFVTLRDVVEEVGSDPVRFMMLYRKCEAPLDFDFAKVTEQSKDNPIFYVQYASARCHSVFRQAQETLCIENISNDKIIEHLNRLTDDNEIFLIRKLSEYPRIIEQAVVHKEPHRLAFYLYDLASSFHTHWNKGSDNLNLRFIQPDDRNLSFARLGLIQAIMNILSSGLAIVGIKAATEMR
ncbi:arginine--tRNA ligase [Bartonella henselae]|uniref:Arginine--tRNA ligase n=1 Tax=Bartonella henselae (strain ATCC 49882 / DSM 28221 / CCUG 30454 / Houston 1) TaxID=283166 RepID=SYR_BARHE|nr:arginine--tRNA ligase [Bartonella henselae]Q6G316.1 RecName: Full=Arginine--tRNA ligase; AltName: Full=Arginyl-tRNA synthetase; Short=ArgRS [Bartonella henselae str. Houston-1]ATP12508.1 arginine--tRNA ligase [Bartonella henselae]ETS08117.1 arginyl-tRNA synthetase [Bartonella henselae JK 50]ETS08665.1 arginyl-tRNA synthetase [Bartonella henselae JK 51]ETS11217.1 arginyl-tRNA synthetase [Bartonella henselae JK 42]ETS15222.1 arginyl-tRNA synthetase [Bartonella henselae JK 41]